MLLTGKDEQQVEFRILGYQFPNEKGDRWDSNWLRIYLKVKSHIGHWETIDPSLTTWEVRELIDWITHLSENNTADEELSFVEPNLKFELISGDKNSKMIRMSFDLESKPKSAKEDDEYYLDFQLNNNELVAVAVQLNSELERFPMR